MAFSGYCNIDEVKDKTIERAIADAGWTNDNIQKRIDEGWSYIESVLFLLGYTRDQLLTCPLVKSLNILYSRYAIIRDIFQNIAPSEGGEPGFAKWREEVDKTLEQIKNGQIILVNNDGELITPYRANLAVAGLINTKNVKRIFTMSPSYEWDIDVSYWENDVVGEK
jgi:hypothetical protein